MKTFIRSTLRVSAISAVMLMANSALAQGVAFITDIRGDATLGAGKAALMAEVSKGARIACMKECQVGIMYLVSGKEITLKGPGDFASGAAEVTANIGL